MGPMKTSWQLGSRKLRRRTRRLMMTRMTTAKMKSKFRTFCKRRTISPGRLTVNISNHFADFPQKHLAHFSIRDELPNWCCAEMKCLCLRIKKRKDHGEHSTYGRPCFLQLGLKLFQK